MTKDMNRLAPRREIVLGEGLLEVGLPSCQVRIRVRLKISEHMQMRNKNSFSEKIGHTR